MSDARNWPSPARCKCADPWRKHPEGFTWETPTGDPWWHIPWGLP